MGNSFIILKYREFRFLEKYEKIRTRYFLGAGGKQKQTVESDAVTHTLPHNMQKLEKFLEMKTLNQI